MVRKKGSVTVTNVGGHQVDGREPGESWEVPAVDYRVGLLIDAGHLEIVADSAEPVGDLV